MLPLGEVAVAAHRLRQPVLSGPLGHRHLADCGEEGDPHVFGELGELRAIGDQRFEQRGAAEDVVEGQRHQSEAAGVLGD